MLVTRSFLQEIRANPMTIPGLIYADWLAENGQAGRAEFIRLRASGEATADRLAASRELEDRATTCLSEYEERWLGPIPGCLKSGGSSRLRRVAHDPRRGGYRDVPAACRPSSIRSVTWLRFKHGPASLQIAAT